MRHLLSPVLGMFCVLFIAANTCLAADPAELPKCPPNWKVEVIAETPKLLHPSVVCCAPDGRLFVGEDPMDMGNDSKTPTDRILCYHPDGKVTVFADHMYAVFGMAYIDGKLYVHHCPKFSVFTDDHGVGKDRNDIIECTNPNPAPGFNDHIPSNMRLAMDGYLYVSTGDKGVFGAVGKDGRKCEIYGGGVFRIRPDGTGLETYCTGTRNHLDVAINGEDEIFTYDNTDDGNGWWTRVTHMVDGGFYGYPWDYKPKRPYTLWMMGDYGGGAPTGALAYNEDALPEEYHGNLFLCEWGRKQLLRLTVERDGGSYKITKREDFLTAGTKEFRPVGIAVSPDGMSLYVTDWNFGGWKQKVPAGRLLKVTYTGASKATPKPKWYIPAAMGEKCTATNAELIEGLKHPSQAVRLVAQRRLAERGKEAVDSLGKLLRDSNAPPHARWSAIWALDEVGRKEKNPANWFLHNFTDALKDGNSSVARQAARQIGNLGLREAVPSLTKLLNDADLGVRFQAATALGRIGDHAAIAPLIQALKQTDLFCRYAAFTALNRIGHTDPKYWSEIVTGLADPDPRVREGTYFAIRNTFENGLVSALRELAIEESAPRDVRCTAITTLAEIHRKPIAWDGKWWGTQPVKSPRPLGTVDWAGTQSVLAALTTALKDSNLVICRAAAAGTAITRDAEFAPALVELFHRDTSTETRQTILKAAAALKSPGPLAELVIELLNDPKKYEPLLVEAVAASEKIGGKGMIAALTKLLSVDTSSAVLTSTLNALGSLKAAEAVPAIAARLTNPEANVKNAAVAALIAIGGPTSTKSLLPLLTDAKADTRRMAVIALGALKSTATVEPLLKSFADPETQFEALEALSSIVDPRAVDVYLVGLASKSASIRDGSKKALTSLRREAWPLIDKKLEDHRLSPEVVGELQAVYLAKVPVNWSILGLFAANAETPFDVAKPNPKADFQDIKGKKIRWKEIKPALDKDPTNLDWRKELRPEEECVAFAHSEIFSPDAGEIEIAGGYSGASLTIWLNGKEIFHADKGTKIAVKSNANAGSNELVVRAHNTGGSWSLKLAYTTAKTGKLFVAAATKPLDLNAYTSFSKKTTGAAEKGKALFSDMRGLGCMKCHKVNGQGTGEAGPDLAGVGAKYNRDQLIESVLYPSKQILDGYQQTQILLSSGQTKVGIVRGETPTELTVYDVEAKKTVIKKADIEERKILQKSLMPDGLQQGLSLQDFADLIGYLESLKEKPPEKK